MRKFDATTMPHTVPRRERAASEDFSTKSSPTLKTCRNVNLCDSICSPHWWDEVFEASDLAKSTRCTGICLADDSETVVSEASHDHPNLEAVWGDESSACGVGALPCSSSPSSALLNQHDSKLLYPSRLKIHAAKIALNSGKEHLSMSGRIRRARCLKNPCHSNCRRCQHPRLTAGERQIILDHFWSLKSHEKQWRFISNAVSVSTPKRKFAVQGSKGAKNCSREYFFSINGRKRKVCKTMFIHTLSICDSWIESALSHVSKGLPDLRGWRKKLVSRS